MGCIIKRCWHDLLCRAEAAKASKKDKDKIANSKAYTSPIQPSSAFHLRNRLLSRMGTKVGSQVPSCLVICLVFHHQIPDHIQSSQRTSAYYHLGILK